MNSMRDDERPDPDLLLEKIQRAESEREKGKLKIFFGEIHPPGSFIHFAFIDIHRAPVLLPFEEVSEDDR